MTLLVTRSARRLLTTQIGELSTAMISRVSQRRISKLSARRVKSKTFRRDLDLHLNYWRDADLLIRLSALTGMPVEDLMSSYLPDLTSRLGGSGVEGDGSFDWFLDPLPKTDSGLQFCPSVIKSRPFTTGNTGGSRLSHVVRTTDVFYTMNATTVDYPTCPIAEG